MKSSASTRPLGAMFCLGAVSTFSQVLLLREMLVAFSSNEMTIGAILGVWLIGIASGATLCRIFLPFLLHTSRLAGYFMGALLLLSALLPVQVLLVRYARTLTGLPVSEYASLWQIMLVTATVSLPGCLCVGFCFPLATQCLAGSDDYPHRATPASRIYTLEGLGSAAAGVALTFVLLGAFDTITILLLASCLSMLGAASLTRGRWSIAIVLMVVAVLVGLAFDAPLIAAYRCTLETVRWQSLGVLPRGSGNEIAGVRLVASEESVYQSLGITESEGQFALYGNGEPLFVFPDPLSYEHSIHFIMAQNPGSRRILLLGGNPLGDVPELLKYGPDVLVYVSLDPAVGRLVRSVDPDHYDRTMQMPSVRSISSDAVHYVKNCRERFDAIILNAPRPSTVANNRFYCRSFFRDLVGILTPGGFLTCAVTSSVQLSEESVSLPASVYHTLRDVFESVLVTAGTDNRFFAGMATSGITLDAAALARRSRGAGIETEFFRPEYFLGCDDISVERVAFTRERLESTPPEINTVMNPAAYGSYMALWSRFSGSGVERVYRAPRARGLGWGWRASLAVAASLVLAVGLGVRRAGGAVRVPWSRSMILMVSALTGLCGMALEVVVLILFQSIFGYIYTRIGFVVALFMIGLVAGATSGRHFACGPANRWQAAYLGTECALLALPAALLVVVRVYLDGSVTLSPSVLAGVMYGSVGAIGWLVGAQFPMANRLCLECGSSVASASARVDAADHTGAAIGAIATGAVFIPLLGIDGTSLLLVSVKVLSACCLVSALAAMPRHLE